ncbi:M23 family metallopeptidase [Bacillus sp. AFS055030]|uniref:murein hydrolase activator EnvC family protein n=1 Tax=Bacillus sp. AFS055030 TaxID=2033507 RepID=UPI000BFCF6BF|nr:M23 family metallopeptidase [Bacillus sp. AFS055030]PGL71493.1 peptidase M23 [Bacillus sp. AFS055030]
MNKRKSSKVITIMLCSTFIIGAIPSVSFAESKYQSEIDRIIKKRSEVKDKTDATKNKIADIKHDQQEVVAELKKLDAQMKLTKQKVSQTEDAVSDGKKQISKLKEEIKFIEERIKSREELLKNRMRSLQKAGGMVSYIDVILGANSFGDLIQRMNAVQTIMKADEDIINQQNLDLKEVSAKKDDLTKKQAKIERDLANLKSLNNQLASQVSEKNELMASLKAKESEAHEDVLDLTEQDQLLASQQAAMQKALEIAKKQAAERAAAEARQKAEAKRKAEAEAAAKSKKPSTSTNHSNGSGSSSSSVNASNSDSTSSSENTPTVSSGNFTRPANGYVSSGFGQRSFEGGEFHEGVDIASAGSVPVVAAGDGVVIRAYVSSSYGNCVFITHNINGQVWTTVYAHLASFNVSTGQTVSKGMKIGYMGNTGHSTGQHLHFELHKGEWNYAKSNAVNPMSYINF